jgi:2-keto-4-pentenoate hydratase
MTGAVLQGTSTEGVSGIAASFVRARLMARPLSDYPGAVPTDTVAAYACQEAAIAAWPDEVVGWKVARISKEWADKFSEPRLNGPVFSRNVHIARGAIPACPIFEGGFAAVESEIVIRVGNDAPASKITWSIAEANEFIGGMYIGIEVASSPLATLNDFGPGAVMTDFGNNWGVVVGDEILDWRNIDAISCEAFIDGQPVGAKPVSIEQGPLSAFAFTLGKCAARGRPLKAGAWITTGMITGVHDIRIGQQSRHVFAGYGEVGCRAVRAVPFE